MTLRSKLIRLASAQPALRPHLLPLLKKAETEYPNVAEMIYPIAKHCLDRYSTRYNKGTLSFMEHGAETWHGSNFENIPALLRANDGMSGDFADFLEGLHSLLGKYTGKEVECPDNIGLAWLITSGKTNFASINLSSEYKIGNWYGRSRSY